MVPNWESDSLVSGEVSSVTVVRPAESSLVIFTGLSFISENPASVLSTLSEEVKFVCSFPLFT